jgi:hypothetical protein
MRCHFKSFPAQPSQPLRSSRDLVFDLFLIAQEPTEDQKKILLGLRADLTTQVSESNSAHEGAFFLII